MSGERAPPKWAYEAVLDEFELEVPQEIRVFLLFGPNVVNDHVSLRVTNIADLIFIPKALEFEELSDKDENHTRIDLAIIQQDFNLKVMDDICDGRSVKNLLFCIPNSIQFSFFDHH